MKLDDIYNTIFPLNSVDNNNRYINMASDDLSTIQLLEPTIGVSEFVIPEKDRITPNNLPDRMAFRLPLVSINDVHLRPELITDFYIDYSSFVPTVMVEFVDLENEMLSTNSVRDGSTIKIYIGGNGDELYYKPIRQDFMITNIIKMNSGDQNMGDYIQYRLTGSLNVPMGHRKESWSNSPATSMQELFNLAIYTGLGFATNFTYKTIDEMAWVNTLGYTYFEFMQNIAEHACYSPNTFFTAFIDQYYVLNFVECHSLLSHGGSKTDTPAMIYSNMQESKEPNVNKTKNNGENKETTDQIRVDTDNGQNDLMNDDQKLSYYFISNHNYFKGWSNYIESYNEISDGYSSMDDGYRKNIIYSDSNSSGWGTNGKWSIAPIDNLERDDLTQQIKPLSDTVSQDSYIPLNLMQTNNYEYQKETDSINKMSEVESFINFGEVDTTNMFKQYYFAQVQNEYQMRCMKKCGLNLTLQNYNPSITKFSRIWVDIYDMNSQSTENIKPNEKLVNNSTFNNDYKKYVENKNKNIIYYKDEGILNETTKTTDGNGNEKTINDSGTNFPRGNYNRSLSGWYVVTELKIVYNKFEKNLKTQLILNRIEHKPLYKNDYTIAKNAIDKYREENLAECIYNNIDDYSY